MQEIAGSIHAPPRGERPKLAEIRFPLCLSGQFGWAQIGQDVIVSMFIDAGRLLGVDGISIL